LRDEVGVEENDGVRQSKSPTTIKIAVRHKGLLYEVYFVVLLFVGSGAE
jgi:hypothetical protein